jgi:large subunit ribosomal protein L25
MADTRLAAAVREDRGSARAGRLRKTGQIPGIVYGTGHEPIAVSVDGRELRNALSGDHGLNALLDLQLDGETHSAMARELQRHPVKGTLQHVDFQIVRLDQIMTVDVPVELRGEAHEVALQGGEVLQDLGVLTVNATPRTIPSLIEVDISALEIGHVIRLSDLTLPDGVTCDLDPETVIVTGLAPRVADELEEGAEGAEGAAAEGADGEAVSGEGASEAPAEEPAGE